jgi:hypothetical protein
VALGPHPPADGRTGLEEMDIAAGARERTRAYESGQARPDDRDLYRRRQLEARIIHRYSSIKSAS